MKTLRWDLFYEIQHMETVADERTARLEARRNKWLLRTYPWLLLVIYLFAGMFVGWDGGIRPLLLLALFLPVLCNTLLSLRDGTLCTDEDHEGAQSSRIGAKIDLLVRPFFVFWYFFNLLLQGPTPSRWGWEMLLALAPATGCACLYWALAAMAHGHCLWVAGREGEELPPPSRREGLAKAVWALLLAASVALTVLGVRGIQQAAVPEELRPLENLTDPTWTVPEEGQVWTAACRVQVPDVPGVIAGETQGLVWLGQIDNTRYRVSLAIENGQVAAACLRALGVERTEQRLERLERRALAGWPLAERPRPEPCRAQLGRAAHRGQLERPEPDRRPAAGLAGGERPLPAGPVRLGDADHRRGKTNCIEQSARRGAEPLFLYSGQRWAEHCLPAPERGRQRLQCLGAAE